MCMSKRAGVESPIFLLLFPEPCSYSLTASRAPEVLA